MNKVINSWMELSHGTKIIDKTDGMVMEFYITKDEEYYLANDTCVWALFQFSEEDFELYHGEKQVGEYDKEYLQTEE